MQKQNKVTNHQGETQKAGGIVVDEKQGKKYVLLVYRAQHGFHDWTFPKGHVEPDESANETAIREIREECGIETKLTKELPSLSYVKAQTDERVLVRMFLLKPLSTTLIAEYPEDKVEWVLIDAARDLLSYDNLKEYFDMLLSDNFI